MNPIWVSAALIFVSVATPGPNNLLVLRQSMAHGIVSVAAPIASIVLGGGLLLAAALAGMGALLGRWPRLGGAVVAAGCGYLFWLGLRLALRPQEAPEAGAAPAAGRNGIGLFALQFANPKGWTLAIAVAGAWRAASAGGAMAALTPLLLFAALSGACLLGWALLGRLLARALQAPRTRRWFDRGMGVVLMLSAALLPFTP